MRSPGGLRFLNTLEEHPHRLARSDSDGMLDQVCLDIPAPLWEEELAFWKALTGRELEHGLRTEFALLADPDPHGAPRILLQRLDSSHGQVDAHLDFAVADRARQTAWHAAAGAQVVNVMGRLTVMRAPDRHVYCLTDRDPASGRVRPRPDLDTDRVGAAHSGPLADQRSACGRSAFPIPRPNRDAGRLERCAALVTRACGASRKLLGYRDDVVQVPRW